MGHFSRRQLIIGASALGGVAALPTAAYAAPTPVARDPSKDILGIDASSYPGDQVYDEAWSNLSSRFTCFYLSHSSKKLDPTWGKDVRRRLAMKGWGFIPTYNGTQDDANLNAAIGTQDAKQAVDLMSKAGFTTGQVMYLDVENAHPDPKDMYWEYVRAWIAQVKNQYYYPGIYSVYPNADIAAEITSAVWTAELPKRAKEIFGVGTMALQSMQNGGDAEELFKLGILSYDLKKDPHGKIYKGCIATQYRFKQYPKNVGNGKIELDFDASLVANPSDTACIVAALKLNSLI